MSVLMIYGTIILLCAVTGMTMLLNLNPMEMTVRKRRLFVLSLTLVVFISILLMFEIGRPFIALYPLLIHLPLIIIFYALSGRGWVKVLFVLLTMIFLSYPPSLAYLVSEKYFHASAPIKLTVLLLGWALVLFCIRKYMQQDFHYVMEHLTTRETIQFCFVPIGYNILVYSLARYDYNINDHPTRIVLFLSVLCVYSLLLGFFRHTREMEAMQRERDVLELQMQAASKQIVTLQSSSDQAALYRHDMRHQLALLSCFLSDGDLKGAVTYLKQAQEDIDTITPVCYCRNHTVNLILSHFVDQAEKLGVSLLPEANLSPRLGVSETELCALLSNALENAISAVSKLENAALRSVNLTIDENRDKLLVMVQNPYSGALEMKNGIPVSPSARDGHGFGCHSMVAMTEKQGGFCTFKAENGLFTLRLALPLAPSSL